MTGDQEPHGLLDALGRLWMAGVTIDWQQFYANERRLRVVVPTYPFERKRYWPDSPITARTTTSVAQAPVAVAGNGVESSTSALSLAAQNIAAPIAPPTEVQPDIPRKERLLAASRSLMEELSGYDLSEVDPAASLMELGLDSLLLTQAAQVFQKKFGVSISFRQLMEELGSLKDIAEYLDAKLAPEAFARADEGRFRAGSSTGDGINGKFWKRECAGFHSRTDIAATAATHAASFAVDGQGAGGPRGFAVAYERGIGAGRAVGSDGHSIRS